MADKADVLLALFSEERSQARQSEDQRATLSNIILVIVGAGLAFVTDRGLGASALAVSVPMALIGVYGAIATGKYFERWYRHWMRSYAYQAQLFQLYPDIDARLSQYSHEQTRHRKDVYESEAEERFPRLSRLRLYRMWIALHCAIAGGGLVLTLLILPHVV